MLQHKLKTASTSSLTAIKEESHKDNSRSQFLIQISLTIDMADKDLLMIESYTDSDSGFDSDYMDCSGPLAMSGRCDLHKGLRIEVTTEPLSMRRIANVIIALQRLKPSRSFRSTEFTDQELFNIFMENVIEESMGINLKCSESKSYSMQDKVVQCTICDKSKRALVRKEKPAVLLAITLKGGNEENKAWFSLSAYTPPNCKENTRGQPICLGIVKSNLFLSCTLENETPFLGIEEVKGKDSLKAIKENDGMERFLFFRNGTGESLNTFESVKYPGWFITTSKDDFKPVQMCKQQPSHLQLFTLQDETIVSQNEI